MADSLFESDWDDFSQRKKKAYAFFLLMINAINHINRASIKSNNTSGPVCTLVASERLPSYISPVSLPSSILPTAFIEK